MVFQLSEMLPVIWVVHIDFSISEIAHEQLTAEFSKMIWSQGQSPWGVQCAMFDKPLDQIACGVENVDKSVSLAFGIIMLIGQQLQGKSDIKVIVDEANVEWRVVVRQFCVCEGEQEVKPAIEDIHFIIMEIGGVEADLPLRGCRGQSFVDCAERGSIHYDDGIIGINYRVIAQNRAAFCSKQINGGSMTAPFWRQNPVPNGLIINPDGSPGTLI